MKIGFISLGCSKNRVDSEWVMGLLQNSQHEIVTNPQLADVIFINTCGFITIAKEEAIETILQMSDIKKTTGCKLVVLGCLSQRYQKDLIDLFPEVDRFITIDEYPLLDKILSEELHIPIMGTYGKHPRLISTQPWMAYLKIAEGCSNRCSYCAIPLIRGDYRSYPMEQLISEAQQLAKAKVKELVIIAQDTTRYGIDLYNQYRLVELIEGCAKIEGIQWIRVLYMYPEQLTSTMIAQLAKIPKFLPYFDLPIQHGDDRMLQAMNRRGTIAQIKDTIQTIRDTFDNPVIRTTMIVGFPQEKSSHFKKMLRFVEEVEFDRLGAFTYSKEEDTPAYHLTAEPKESTKQNRYHQLMVLQTQILVKKQKQWIGKTLEIIIESIDPITKIAKGRGYNSAPDNIDGYTYVKLNQVVPLGSFIKVIITKIRGNDMIGEWINEAF